MMHILKGRKNLHTCRNDDNGAKEADFGVGESEAVDALGQLKDAVHQEFGVPRRHRRDRLPSYHIPVQTNQALKKKNYP